VQTIHTRIYEALDAICWQSDEVCRLRDTHTHTHTNIYTDIYREKEIKERRELLFFQGLTSVMKAFQTKYDGLQFIVDELQSTDAVELKKAALQLIFHLVNVNDDLKERITIRQEFLDRGMIRCLQRVRDWCEEKSVIAEKMIKAKSAKGTYVSLADLQLLNNQCSVFEEEMNRDRREAASNALIAGDLDAVKIRTSSPPPLFSLLSLLSLLSFSLSLSFSVCECVMCVFLLASTPKILFVGV